MGVNIVVVWSAESINMDKFSAFGKNISSAFNTTVSPFVQRSQQQLKEQFGSVEDKTQLPADYVELEKRVDALKQVHQKLLAVTNQYQRLSTMPLLALPWPARSSCNRQTPRAVKTH